MHAYYQDILERIAEPPLWFDERAVPRYCQFSPRVVANIYANEVALVLIRCQGCGHDFNVAFSELNLIDKLWSADRKTKLRNISALIEDGSLHYGDPPNVRCCSAGATMNSIPVRVLQYWYKPIVRREGVDQTGLRVVDLKALQFRRDPALEEAIERS